MSDIVYHVTTRGQLPADVVERVSRAAARLMVSQKTKTPTGSQPAGGKVNADDTSGHR